MKYAIYGEDGKWMFNVSATNQDEAMELAKQQDPNSHHAEESGLDRNDAF